MRLGDHEIERMLVYFFVSLINMRSLKKLKYITLPHREREKTYHKQREDIEPLCVPSPVTEDTDGPPHHGVLPHEYNRVGAKTLPDALHLRRSHIVCSANQHTLIAL